ncbi:MAG: class I mannose-6-phosphate isomerase [Butyrivibrio sp.]|uniref:type I phosphomannose isomerase catalytic subunit n=1 Tax=Butyrivibrio sp. TaxID=28121 RepID=UPI001B6114F2|nr:type I phosphomannose isomerase catalytic subunit [Butyrivibrio sp.]MBP3783784.1 class I mannose-6-phosphate isomerase [Butyrivibrio sp.]
MGKERSGAIPFLLKPAGKDYLWGGQRLNDDFSKKINMDPLAETWECSTHPDGLSTVSGGEFDGKTLKDVISMHPEFLGQHYEALKEIPILIKFIDARSDLSVQVHPSDEYAFEHENGQRGKTEMWYVLDASAGARLVYGLRHDCTKEEFLSYINEGKLERHLQYVPIKKNDVFYIESGTIHAIGAGALVAEIQESSNLTYRIYDYNRVDKNGKLRELHIDKALEVSNLKGLQEPRQKLRVLRYGPGVARELLSRCKYFEVNRMLVNTERRQDVFYESDELSFKVLLCFDGCGTVCYEDEDERRHYIDIYKGDCLFVPANSRRLKLNGRFDFLDVRC